MLWLVDTDTVRLRQQVIADLARRDEIKMDAVARRARMSRQYLYMLMAGTRPCSRRNGRRIADALDVSLDTITLPAGDSVAA